MKTWGLKSFCGERQITHLGGCILLFVSEVMSYSVFLVMDVCRDALSSVSKLISSMVCTYVFAAISGLT